MCGSNNDVDSARHFHPTRNIGIALHALQCNESYPVLIFAFRITIAYILITVWYHPALGSWVFQAAFVADQVDLRLIVGPFSNTGDHQPDERIYIHTR